MAFHSPDSANDSANDSADDSGTDSATDRIARFASMAILCLGCMGVVGCWSRPVTEVSAARTLSAMESLKNQSIALMENGAESDSEGKMLKEAMEGFRRIAKEVPKDHLGHQNLCVSLLLYLKRPNALDNTAEYGSLSKEFEQSAQLLDRLTPSDPDSSYLKSLYHQIRNERPAALASMQQAVRKPNANAATQYQLYKLFVQENLDRKIDGPGEDQKPIYLSEMEAAIRSGIQLAPNNIVLGVALLDVLAKSHNTEFKSQLDRCRELFRPLVARTSSWLPSLVEKCLAAVDAGDWNLVGNQVSRLRNVLLAELAFLSDLHELEPHELDLVQLNFQPTSLPRTKPVQRDTEVPWRFQSIEASQLTNSGATAIASEDFDLDGNADLAIAVGNQVRILSISTDKTVKAIASVDLGMTCSGMALADLDHDYQVRKEALPPSALPTTRPPDSVPTDGSPTDGTPAGGTPSGGTPTGGSSTGSPLAARPDLIAKFLDTDVDLIAFGGEGIRLFRNDLNSAEGTRSLTAMPQSEAFAGLRGIKSIAVIDLDHDSDLDLAVSSASGLSLWSNRGNWTFADFSSFSQLPAESKAYDSVLALDLDRNVLNDFLLGAEDVDQPTMLANSLHGRYRLSSLSWGTELKGACRALEAMDVNGDACWDIVSCGRLGTRLTVMKSVGRHGWSPDSTVSLSSRPMIGIVRCDFDNDGFEDCVSWGLEGLELFTGGADGKLVLSNSLLEVGGPVGQVTILDFDRDGDEDLVCLTGANELRCFENRSAKPNQHLEVVIRADEDGSQRPRERCNMHGVGSLIELKSGGRYQAKIVRGTKTKFGLGTDSNADIMRVLWTNGIPNNILNVTNRATIFDQQNLGGSCPYLYAWDGERFAFCTDCLWAAPIGLQFEQGVSAPTREWEYLKLDGRQVQPKNGRYVLQLTEELWEAAYFDSVQLMAVDHPADVEIFTNEKVGPAEIAEFQVHTVRNRLNPRRVIDQRGRDVADQVAVRDQRFTRTWTEGFNQGLVEQHWLELDLNDDAQVDKKQIKLFLTGWVFPTGTSLNLAMTENPDRPKLAPPSVHVPDEAGNWVEVIPYAGFPGGKTKTIVIDLSGKFLSNDRRVRIVTNMELCWDEVFWTAENEVDEAVLPPSAREKVMETESFRLTRLDLVEAELHYRGFSQLVPRPGNAPKRFDYESVSTESIWPPMSGNFTRFGNVTELISEADDVQVVMGAGDEMTVEFSVDDQNLPPGWKRDFIIYNVGWDKDADLNTVHGQSVEPLPFRSMGKYPYEPEESFPSGPKYADFLRQFQTRKQQPNPFWNQIRDRN